MKYWNQKKYPEMPYPNNLDHPESRGAVAGNVAGSGCGLCSACMMVGYMTLDELSLEECRDFSIETGANHSVGTDMEILGAALAARYHLDMKTSNDTQELLDCLQKGGSAIINVGGDREGYIGVFSHRGHYIFARGYDGREVCILDPSQTPDKYQEEGRVGKVRVDGNFVYTRPEVLTRDTENRNPGYYLFRREA